MPSRNIVVVGTSAGGLEALRFLAAQLPPAFPAPVCVVMHSSPDGPGVLHEILSRAGGLEAISPRDGESLRPGRIYVAPPDRHLLVEPGIVRVTKGPKENRFRPAIDPLFRSAAQVYGPAAIGVILTGNLDDGTAGLVTVKQLGGTAIVQDPADAPFPSMPLSALRHAKVDHQVALTDLPALLVRLTAAETQAAPAEVPETVEVEVEIAKEKNALDAGVERIAAPSSYACPECHGVLLQLADESLIRFRCHTGHAYSAESLLAALSESVEAALWGAIRALEESSMLVEQMSRHLREHRRDSEAERFAERAAETHRQSKLIRALVTTAPVGATEG
jgi:two-component system chemotaxis response regulator CheB